MLTIFPIYCTHPLICPQKRFTDMYGHKNAYFETNPSMHISEEGDVTVLIRRVNYRKFHDRSFVIFTHKPDSSYVIARGSLAADEESPFDVNQLTYESLTVDYNLPTYPSYWTGVEDIRFINGESVLTTVPELDYRGQPTIFRATLEKSRLHTFLQCSPSETTEKNWMPFHEEERNYVIYQIYPFKIKSVINPTFYIPTQDSPPIEIEDLRGYHGSTNGIPFTAVGFGEQSGTLFLIHKNVDDHVEHRWIFINMKTGLFMYSAPFRWFKHAYIEFPCSLCIWKTRVFVSLGVNDDKAYILELRTEDIQASLATITQMCGKKN